MSGKSGIKTLLFLSLLLIMGTSVYGQSASWLKVKKLDKKTWCITDNGIVNMYLLEGKEKALLIDNGYGVANLRDLVKSLTKLPLTVVVTHGHRDHCGAAYQFQTIYANSLDFDAIQFNNLDIQRKNNSQAVLKDYKLTYSEIFKDTLNLKPIELKEIGNGYVFDLGKRKVEVIEVPGHTAGSIVLLDISNKMLFSGDHINRPVWLFLKGCLPVDAYLKSLEKIKLRAKEFTKIYPGHNEPLDSDFLDELILCCKSILDGTCKSEKYDSNYGDAMQCTYKRANVDFNPNNLFENK